jgi:hypothetical protein
VLQTPSTGSGTSRKSFTNELEILGFIRNVLSPTAKRPQQNQVPKLKTGTLPLNYSPVTPQILKNIRFFKMKEVDVRVKAGARD